MTRNTIRTGVGIAVVFGVVGVATTVSFATLVFGEDVPEFLNAGIAHFLLGGGVAGIVLAVASSLRGQFGGVQDVSAAIAGAIAISVASSLDGSSSEVIFANALIALIAATFLTGLFFVVMGRLRLGNFVRFVPFPVMAGFLAATGWLLFKGGLEVASGGGHLEILHLGYFIDHAHIDQLGIAILVGFAIFIVGKLFEGRLWVLPGILAGATALFFLIVAFSGAGLDELRGEHWFVGPLPDTAFWEALTVPDLGIIEWDALAGSIGSILTFVVVSSLALLVTVSGLELAMERDIDVNKEMERSGLANMLAGLTGAPTSWVDAPSTAVAHSRGALHPVFGVIHGGVMLVAFLAGPVVIGLFPRFIAGGLLVFLGLELIGEWIVDTRKEMPRVDYAIVLAIVAAVELLGFLPGVGVGLVSSIVLFVVRYSSLQSIRNQLDGGAVQSGRDRPIPDERLLDHFDHRTLTVQLQGFIFFGSAYAVYASVKETFEAADDPPGYLVLDMRLVQGIDSSATTTLIKTVKLLRDYEGSLIVVPGSPSVRRSLEQAGLNPDHFDHLHLFDKFNEAIEWCEEQVLASAREQLQGRGSGTADADFLEAVFGDVMAGLEVQEEFEELVAALRPRMEVIKAETGVVLFDEQDENRRLFFIVSGRVALERVDMRGEPMRVRALGRWNMVGEIGAFLGYREPSTARVEQAGEILALSADDIAALVTEAPELAQRLQRLTIQMMGSELAKTTQNLAQP